jgi:beta-glucosidase
MTEVIIPADFMLGVATAAYQIEGAVTEDGRGVSVWDTFSNTPGKTLNGDTGSVACDHYHRFEQDLDLVRELGADAYRCSISWPRIQPDGSGEANPKGLAFYDRLVDAMLARQIVPVVTLFHWDTPQALEDAGGWLVRDTAERFGEYAAIMGELLGDRVGKWITINEPCSVSLAGYATGFHAPGKALLFDSLPSVHHQLLGHGLAVQALRAAGVTGEIGITNVHTPVVAASDRIEDVVAADFYDLLANRIFEDPVLLGRYPQATGPFEGAFDYLHAMPQGDLEIISSPLDFYGVNYYYPTRISAPGSQASNSTPEGEFERVAELPFAFADFDELPKTGFGWPISAQGLGDTLRELSDRYGDGLPPVYITEGGASFPDEVEPDGRVRDSQRVDYLRDHIGVALRERAAGLDLRGYFVWSLLDNFEWAAGYSQRFGLVHVDYESQQRTPKDSFRWLAEQLRAER